VLVILSQPKRVSLRRLALKTQDNYFQIRTGVEPVPVSFTAIASWLRKIPQEAWLDLMTRLYQLLQTVEGPMKPFKRLLKWFDTTTISMSAVRNKWAAPNGAKKAIRVALRWDDRTEKIELVVNGSHNTSDNTIFQQLMARTKKGSTLVFDAGFTFYSLPILAKLVDQGLNFVSVRSQIYSVKALKTYPLPSKTQIHSHWVIIQDEELLVGADDNSGQAQYRQITYQNQKTGEQLLLFTNLRKISAKRIFELYHRRWRIEVLFRWLKSDFALKTIPAFTEAGVWSGIYLNLITFLILRYWNLVFRQMTHWRH